MLFTITEGPCEAELRVPSDLLQRLQKGKCPCLTFDRLFVLLFFSLKMFNRTLSCVFKESSVGVHMS